MVSTSLPFTGTVPVIVSLVGASGGVDGAVDDPALDPPEHAAVASRMRQANQRVLDTFRITARKGIKKSTDKQQGCHRSLSIVVKIRRKIYWGGMLPVACRGRGGRRSALRLRESLQVYFLSVSFCARQFQTSPTHKS